jgi:hypothetical protein
MKKKKKAKKTKYLSGKRVNSTVPKEYKIKFITDDNAKV